MQYQLYIYNLKSRFGDQSFSAAVFSPSLRERLDETDYYDFDVCLMFMRVKNDNM